MSDKPNQPRAVPGDDELPARPLRTLRLIRVLFAVVLVALGLLGPKVGQLITPHTSSFDNFVGGPLKRVYTGIDPLDRILSLLVGASSFVAAGDELAPRVIGVYFWATLLAPTLLWLVDGYRRSSARTLVSM